MIRRTARYLLAWIWIVMLGTQVHAQGVVKQSEEVLGQTSNDCTIVPLPGGGPRPVLDGASATVLRTPNGVSASASMPTPGTGEYCYPPLNVAFNPASGPAMPGHPEVWTFWGIYFNNPEECMAPGCSAADVLGPNCVNAQAGAIKLAGHVGGGGTLHLSGHLSVGEGPLGPLGCAPFWNVEGSELHLAAAPHGLLMPSLMPSQIQAPPGGGPGYWFPAIFDPVE